MIPVFRPEFGEEEKELLNEVIDSGLLTEGAKTHEFEDLLKDFLNVDYVVVVPSGGIALYLALLAVGVREGVEVIVPDYCHVSLSNSVRMIGAKPKFADVDYTDGCVRWKNVGNSSTFKTKCLATVDMNGRYCDYDALSAIVDNGYPIIQDSCQSLPSTYEGKHLFGSCGCLSFHVTKIITMGGTGGAVFTNDVDVYREVKKFKDYGRFVERKTLDEIPDYYDSIGNNFRVNELMSVVGIAQFHQLGERIERMREVYYKYLNNLKPKMVPEFHVGHVHWVFDIRVGDPQKMKTELAKRGIETRLPYVPMHHQPLYAFGRDFVGSDTWSGSCLWLPSSPSLTDDEVTTVIKEVNEVYEELKELKEE